MPEDLVRLENIVFRRGRKTIFDGLSVTVPVGKTVAFMGPSGTGKTTLLKLIGGQLTPDSGKVIVRGRDISQMSRAELFSVRRDMGMLFQSGALFTDLTVFENVAFPLRIHTDLSDDLIRDLVLIKLHAVGLRGASSLNPAELSGGMQRRIALARAMALDPSLIMYDEPFTGLDPIAMGVIVQLIRRVADVYRTTSIIVSHDIEETAGIADYIYLISDGRLIGEGEPGFLREDKSPRVRQFMDGLPDGPVPFHYPAPDFEEELMSEDREIGWFRFD
ncbi:MAG: ABC transporter ATP-binding protein [Gammaproteobacteria bacterium]|jgi:phospholipid/cholesterol/gamma-HCH transport system ATP-binding protein|nr:ABC transporter ATP-binding protein [Gammaproteobacteria bacterium]MBT4494277.1 ABC transporter ATP-binding protein [Gammaproteobacteria bacterium]MBT7371176.1 ABC transporter ATP-binding protein [Gammaproteobacteria bacterium]